MGIAGFSMNKNGEYSNIAGPYYFKLDEVDTKLEQVFNNEKGESIEDLIKKENFYQSSGIQTE